MSTPRDWQCWSRRDGETGPLEDLGGLRVGSTPSRSLETREKCLATLTFMGKDYHHHPHPQQPPGEESGSFSIAETVDCSKPLTPPPPGPAPVVYSSNNPINGFMTYLPGPVYTHTLL